jgi:hypothetical protein
MSQVERARFRALALKVETTPGTDAIAGTPAAGDWVDAAFSISPDFVTTADPSFTGSLDRRPSVIGGGRFMIRGVRVPIRGSGTAGTAPDWFKVLLAAGMVQVDTGAVVGAPTLATNGTGITVTCQAPFAATANLYVGNPVELSGNPVTPRMTLVTAYTVGRLMTMARTFSPPLSTSTLVQIPVHNMLRLTDTETDWKRLTAYAYQAGQLYIGTGCIAANPRIVLVAADMAYIEFDLMGVLAAASPAEVALPTGAAAAGATRPSPPTWINGECQLGRATVRAAEAAFSLGSQGMLPPAPESANGFDPAELMARNLNLDLTLMANSTAAPGRIAAMKANTNTLFSAILGSTPGNRIGLLYSPAAYLSVRNGEREGADVEIISFEPGQAGNSLFISAF